jgi:hypothetical protein
MTELTPAQQALMDFLEKLATSPYSPALMEEGDRAFDAALGEDQQNLEAKASSEDLARPGTGFGSDSNKD